MNSNFLNDNMFGFKGTDKNLKCQNHTYQIKIPFKCNNIKLCTSGYHFCSKLIDVKNYKIFNGENRYFLIKHGHSYITCGDKSVTNEIELLEEIRADNIKYLLEESEYRQIYMNNIDGLFYYLIAEGNLDSLIYLNITREYIHKYNDYAIWLASQYGHINIVKFLFKYGADIHTENDCAVGLASRNGHFEVVKFLCEKGAKINADRDYAIRMAEENNYTDIAQYLRKCLKIN